jgi:hypothetical protein
MLLNCYQKYIVRREKSIVIEDIHDALVIILLYLYSTITVSLMRKNLLKGEKDENK